MIHPVMCSSFTLRCSEHAWQSLNCRSRLNLKSQLRINPRIDRYNRKEYIVLKKKWVKFKNRTFLSLCYFIKKEILRKLTCYWKINNKNKNIILREDCCNLGQSQTLNLLSTTNLLLWFKKDQAASRKHLSWLTFRLYIKILILI